MIFTKKATINGYDIVEEVSCSLDKVSSKVVTIDGKPSKMTYTQACNWAKKTDRRKK